MHRFYLLDHSLKKIGGHHYEYALHVLNAAAAAGFQPVLGAHRKFQAAQLPADWLVATPFRESTYSGATIMGNLPVRMPPLAPDANAVSRGSTPVTDRWWFRLQEWNRRRQGRPRTRSFAAGCRQLFAKLPAEPGDHILLATVNELDLCGAMDFWRSDPNSACADWHLQFHFNIEPDWKTAPELYDYFRAELRAVFQACRDEFPRHRLHFYNTTSQLAEQYSRLGCVSFAGLPYPTNPQFQLAKTPAQPRQPLRVTCVGGVRAEKGIGDLVQLIAGLWEDVFVPGQAQLAIQAESTRKLPPELKARLEAGATLPHAPLKLVPHPLSTAAYRDLIVTTDIGLLLYDRRHYQARCSGVLVEMLSAGVPVVAPAGCWLADQIAPAIYAERRRVFEQSECLGGELFPWRGEFAESAQRTYHLPAGVTHLGLLLNWQPLETPWRYLNLVVRTWDSANQELPAVVETLCHDSATAPAAACLPLPPRAARAEVRLGDAYDTRPFAVQQARLKFLKLRPGIPLSAVGQIIQNPADAAPAVRQIIAHYPHYQRTAAEFARSWVQWHSPARVVRELTHPRSQRQVA